MKPTKSRVYQSEEKTKTKQMELNKSSSPYDSEKIKQFRNINRRSSESAHHSSFQDHLSTYLSKRQEELSCKYSKEKDHACQSGNKFADIASYQNWFNNYSGGKSPSIRSKKSENIYNGGCVKYIQKTALKAPKKASAEWFHNVATPVKQKTKLNSSFQNKCNISSNFAYSETKENLYPKEEKQGGVAHNFMCDEIGMYSGMKTDLKLKKCFESPAIKQKEIFDENEISKMKQKSLLTIKKKYISKFQKPFKPIKIPVSHDVPFQVFHSIKGLTICQETNFKTKERANHRKQNLDNLNKSCESKPNSKISKSASNRPQSQRISRVETKEAFNE